MVSSHAAVDAGRTPSGQGPLARQIGSVIVTAAGLTALSGSWLVDTQGASSGIGAGIAHRCWRRWSSARSGRRWSRRPARHGEGGRTP
ncbi:hypothetical protein ACFWC9_13865 [Streptomyces goshikiensis]|uniref:hypothetical protein n=1 Tax=Streptomyces goshikiensis TaxID=1942 RepID=UPI0036BE2F15